MENEKKSAAENFGKMFREFGSAIAEIFNDPDLKAKSKEFAESASESAKVFAQRFKDEEVQGKFKEVGKAAQDFGKNISDYFKSDEEKMADEKNNQNEEKKTEIKVSDNENFKAFDGKFDGYFASGRAARITGYVFAIIFAIAWMIFILFFNNYVAYYYTETINGTEQLRMVPVLTEEFSRWLPVFTVSMLVIIIGNLILAFFERFFLVKIVSILTSGFTLVANAYLLRLFPFDFSLIPNVTLKGVASMITTIILIIIMAGCAIVVIIDFIKLIVFFTRSGSVNE
jgi:hypothetical protein